MLVAPTADSSTYSYYHSFDLLPHFFSLLLFYRSHDVTLDRPTSPKLVKKGLEEECAGVRLIGKRKAVGRFKRRCRK